MYYFAVGVFLIDLRQDMHKLISFVISESHNKAKKGTALEQRPLESAPRYYESSIPSQFEMGEERMRLDGREVVFLVRSYPPDSILVEASTSLGDIFSEDAFLFRQKLVDACHAVAEKYGGSAKLSEEYSVALVSGYEGDPEKMVVQHAGKIASFLKSERQPLDEKEIEYTLSTQIKYGKDDLVIIDWDGAFVFDTGGEIDDIIDLLEVANLQLVRYRALDKTLDEHLSKVTKFAHIKTSGILFLKNRKELTKAFREVIAIRAKAIADFEAADRDIKLIGDWYSARLYDLLSKKFKLDEWKKHIQEKLESLEDIYTIVAENFSVSRHQFLELIQILLFFVLQIGWFVLIIFEFNYFTR